MHIRPSRPVQLALCTGLLALCFGAAAQNKARIGAATQAAPSAAARAAQAAPNPAGLRSTFPAGLTAGSGAAVSTDPTAASTAQATSITPIDATGDSTSASSGTVDTTVMGAAAGSGVRGPAQTVSQGSSGFNAVDVARAFLAADLNGDRELSRAEAGRLRLGGQSFEEMDRNFDGVVTRAEFEDGLR